MNYSFYNETFEFLNCYSNNFYNENVSYYARFSDEYKDDLDNIINDIVNEIKKSTLDENLIINYFNDNFDLQIYNNIDKDEITSYFEDIKNIFIYIKEKNNDELKEFLNNLLIFSFNSSYTKMINNFLVDELIDNISVLINNNFGIEIDYLTKKIISEYDYYEFLLSNIKEIGNNSKKAFINLYKNIQKKMNETIFYLFNDKIFFYLDLFTRKNKNIFKDNFINFYANNLNKYNINFNYLSDIIEDIFLDQNFNKTLDLISKDLIDNNIVLKSKKVINESIENKTKFLNNKIREILNNIQKILDNIKTKELPEDMIIINELIQNFTHVINNQNNRYLK